MKANEKNACGGNFDDWLEVMLTPECNGTCSWCVEKKGLRPDYHAPVGELVWAAVKAGKKNIILLGGEPTLYPDLGNLIADLKLAGMKVYLTTNGSTLTEDFVNRVLYQLDGVNISVHDHWLNGNEKIVGVEIDIQTLKKAIDALRASQVHVRFNCNLILGHIDSRKQIGDYVYWAKNLGADSVRFAELKHDRRKFVNLAKILDYEFGLNDEPFSCGCNQEAVMFGVKISFRQMCGIQTTMRETPPDAEPECNKPVMYYDGKVYNGWQKSKTTVKKEVVPNSSKEVAKILKDISDGKITVATGRRKINELMENLQGISEKRARALESASCRY
jgi:MoaA/NifB/PqqE/SkfB family radical SAM enzyme